MIVRLYGVQTGSEPPMQKLLDVNVLAISIFCGLTLEEPSALSAPGSAAAPCPVVNSSEIHYAPEEDLESVDAALIGDAVKQIDLAAYVLTDRIVIEALRQAAARGVKVRIWRDAGTAVRVGEADVQAQLGGRPQRIEIRSNSPGDELTHLKGYCVDHRLLRTGSASLTPAGETHQDNDLVSLRGVSVCSAFDAKFERAWARS
jgi:phosphatidylserine/phosphatidylglycerophosphate/cardiolipin synthase-like enzyme